MHIREFIEEKFSEPTTCYGHCQQQSQIRFLSRDNDLIACFSCPSGYVSRIINYGEDLNVQKFKEFLSNLLSKTRDVKDEEIRVATRYGWDLGLDTNAKVMRVAYWTQNYRRTKSDDPDRVSVFLCSNCNSLFLQPLSSRNSLCGKCAQPK